MITHKNENFEKEVFAAVLSKAIGSPNRSLSQYARQCGISLSYISRCLNCKVTNSPSTIILQKLASRAANSVTCNELMIAAGYSPLPNNNKKDGIEEQKIRSLCQQISVWMDVNNVAENELFDLFSAVQTIKELPYFRKRRNRPSNYKKNVEN